MVFKTHSHSDIILRTRLGNAVEWVGFGVVKTIYWLG